MDYTSVLHSGGPMVMIHKGWQNSQLGSQAEEKSTKRTVEQRGDDKKQFAFVNNTGSKAKSPEERTLIRRHVRNDYVRAHGTPKTPRKKARVISDKGVNEDAVVLASGKRESGVYRDAIVNVPVPLGYPTEGSMYPIDMSSHTHALLSHYLSYATSRMYPIESCLTSNPLKSSEWIRFAVSDKAMFHAVLYAAAVYLALAEGKTESKDTVYHQTKTMSIVQERMRKGIRADSTIGAISCLALGEAVSGNEGLWRLHMDGLKQMIFSRNSQTSLSPLMLAKLRRSDITGAIDYASTPLLKFARSNNPPIWSMISQQQLFDIDNGVSTILAEAGIHPDIIATLVELAYFTYAIQLASLKPNLLLDPAVFSEDLYWIEYSLLSVPKPQPDSKEQPIDRGCRLGALLYVRAILQEFPHSAIGDSILAQNLRRALSDVDKTVKSVPLLVWLSLIGAMSSKDGEKTWFVIYAKQLTGFGAIISFKVEERISLNRYLDLATGFGRLVGTVWEDITEKP